MSVQKNDVMEARNILHSTVMIILVFIVILYGLLVTMSSVHAYYCQTLLNLAGCSPILREQIHAVQIEHLPMAIDILRRMDFAEFLAPSETTLRRLRMIADQCPARLSYYLYDK